MVRTEIDTGWVLRQVGADRSPMPADGVPAQVPGCVHADLLRAGVIPDPFLDLNETQVQWVALADWRYETTFAWPDDDPRGRTDLVFEGLHTIAAVELNGVLVARTANMHRTYRFDLSGLLQTENRLVVAFESPVRAADRASEVLGRRPHTLTHPYNAIRKMACSFGWDWGPTLPRPGSGDRYRCRRGARPAWHRCARWWPGRAPRRRWGCASRCSERTAPTLTFRSGRASATTSSTASCAPGRPRPESRSRCRSLGCGGRLATASSRSTR